MDINAKGSDEERKKKKRRRSFGREFIGLMIMSRQPKVERSKEERGSVEK